MLMYVYLELEYTCIIKCVLEHEYVWLTKICIAVWTHMIEKV